ncbi:MAG TPA: hypothetical protein VFA41_21485 [Ktedonobacteraceae bacterium]|jgi:photosystem II stability/assembly factor-like uncharacterized protein|nr:hypothetical protein [Ktedonobacteraceae bacterium]
MKHFKLVIILAMLAMVIASCSSDTGGNQGNATPTPVKVNGFGTAANHVHAMLMLPPQVLVLATHYGLFRSQDDGASWQEVAAGPGQLMDGLMTYALSVSPVNPQRLYVLTLPALANHKGVVGLYTSADQGRTWKMAIAASSVSASSIFTAAAGNDTPDEVYIYLSELGSLGLRRSLDDGQHFSSTGQLPFDTIFGILAIPGAPGHLLIYSSQGLASSTDGGIHWQVYKNIQGGIEDVVTAGPHSPIYASGDAGVYVSQDSGASFKQVYSQSAYFSLTVSPQQPQVIYGKTGTAIYRSTDGGHSWQSLPHIQGNLGNLAVDLNNPSVVYLSLSYPTEVYRLSQDGKNWTSITPPA